MAACKDNTGQRNCRDDDKRQYRDGDDILEEFFFYFCARYRQLKYSDLLLGFEDIHRLNNKLRGLFEERKVFLKKRRADFFSQGVIVSANFGINDGFIGENRIQQILHGRIVKLPHRRRQARFGQLRGML